MKKLIVVAALLVMFGGPAIAQSGSKGSTTSGQGAGSGLGTVPEAPIGHRQPRVSDVPSEKNLSDPSDPLSKENQALDKKIKSICRGC
jgi:hypothetical protein